MLKLLFCGDTVPTDDTGALFAAGDVDALFSDVAPVFQPADRVIVNLECALTESEGAIRKCGPNLKGPTASAATLRKAGVTDCSLANNHMLDFGVTGMRDTIRALDAQGLRWFGAGENDVDARRPLLIHQLGRRGGVLAVVEQEYTYALPNQPGAAPFDPFDTLTDVAALRRECDAVVLLYHGGKEQCEYPSPRLRKACQAMARLGADLVLCQHSHIIGCAEEYEGSTIVYGQGNFNFVKAAYANLVGWNTGLMVHVTFDPGMHVTYTPVVSTGHGIRLAQGEEKQALLGGFAARSEMLRDGRWLDGWRTFCESKKDLYTATVRNAYVDADDPRRLETFAHYLDCEAHTDVYRELYKTWHASQTDGAQEASPRS